MGANASKVRSMFDAADAVTLRDVTDGAETSTATETAVSLDELNEAYWHDYEIPAGKIVVPVNVTALDLASTDETYVLALIVDDVLAMNNTPVVVAEMEIKQTGYYEMVVDAKTIRDADTDRSSTGKFMAIRATLGGTTPSITYGAWIAKSLRG